MKWKVDLLNDISGLLCMSPVSLVFHAIVTWSQYSGLKSLNLIHKQMEGRILGVLEVLPIQTHVQESLVVSLAIRQSSKDHKHLTPGNRHPDNTVSMYVMEVAHLLRSCFVSWGFLLYLLIHWWQSSISREYTWKRRIATPFALTWTF